MELLGLSSALLEPVIFDRMPLKDRVDSLVSDFVNEGYESRFGPEPVGVLLPPLGFSPFDGWLPIATNRQEIFFCLASIVLYARFKLRLRLGIKVASTWSKDVVTRPRDKLPSSSNHGFVRAFQPKFYDFRLRYQ